MGGLTQLKQSSARRQIWCDDCFQGGLVLRFSWFLGDVSATFGAVFAGGLRLFQGGKRAGFRTVSQLGLAAVFCWVWGCFQVCLEQL